MEGEVLRPGLKQSFTWSTPFFDVTFVDIKTKKGISLKFVSITRPSNRLDISSALGSSNHYTLN